ncbi:HD domain-containing protein [Phytohabitans flavus]|uniref:HD domain-containing protein n=1 Tax=Phytohabitans flavus TaxID=1076124 RepID=A0A6F8XWR1_9ACTN|nr:HD domain-containing protein [Phytohabitans flavus]BCB78178.1 HD domain-containing protein [Phytohabitans flavus]
MNHDAAKQVTVVVPQEVAGIRIPRTKLAEEALAFARETMSDVLFNHVLRTYLFGATQLRQAGTDYDEEVAFLACLLHDLGLLRQYWTPEGQFEVDGADAARSFLATQGLEAEKIDTVWDAIALHTTFGIALRKQPEISIVCLGSALDFSGVGFDKMPDGTVDAIISAFPRLGFKKDALETMVDICANKPAGVIMHYFAEVGRSRVPGFRLPTVEEILFSAPFDE